MLLHSHVTLSPTSLDVSGNHSSWTKFWQQFKCCQPSQANRFYELVPQVLEPVLLSKRQRRTAQDKVDTGKWKLQRLHHKQACWLVSYRFLVVLLLCMCQLVTGLMRISIGMATVCMVNGTYALLSKEEQDNTSAGTSSSSDAMIIQPLNPCGELKNSNGEEYSGNMNWSPAVQAAIFSGFFYGSVISSLPSGFLADRYGPRSVMTLSLVVYVAGAALTPLAAGTSWILVLFVRSVMGLAEGVIAPCTSATIARWITPNERSMAIAIYTAGNQLCMVIGMPLYAFLCGRRELIGGWPMIFYASAITGIPVCVAWLLLVSNSPDRNKLVSAKERQYIADQLSNQSLCSRKDTFVPWRPMLTSSAVWACNFANFASSLGVFMLQSYLPTYFKQVLSLDLTKNGLFTATPFLVKWLVKLVFGFIADTIRKHTQVNPTNLCKTFNSIGVFGCGAFLVACSYMDCSQSHWALLFLCLATGLSSGHTPGALNSAAALAPQYSGTLRSLTGLFNQLAGMVAPYIVEGVVIQGTREEWQTVFFVVTGIMSIAGLFFIGFGSADLQEWAKHKPKAASVRTNESHPSASNASCVCTVTE